MRVAGIRKPADERAKWCRWARVPRPCNRAGHPGTECRARGGLARYRPCCARRGLHERRANRVAPPAAAPAPAPDCASDARRQGCAIGLVVVGSGTRVAFEQGIHRQQPIQSGPDGKAVFGQVDGRLKQSSPGQAAMLRVDLLQHPQNPRRGHGAASKHRFLQRHRSPVGAQKLVFPGASRRCLSPIPGLNPLAIPGEHQRPTADAAALGLHQREHHLHRDRRVHRRTTRAQHQQTGLGGQGVGGGHHLARARPSRPRRPTRSRFRLDRICRKGQRRRHLSAPCQEGPQAQHQGQAASVHLQCRPATVVRRPRPRRSSAANPRPSRRVPSPPPSVPAA